MENSKKDKMINRFLMMIKILNSGRGLDPKVLPKEFGISLRTFQRDIPMLMQYCDIELVKDKDGCYHIARGLHEDGSLTFGDIKIFAKNSGLDGLYPCLNDEMIADVLNPKIDKVYDIKTESREDIRTLKSMFDDIGGAILECVELDFYYSGSQRFVKPYKLINNSGVWYLLGDEKAKLKHFALSKIKNLKITDKNFEPSKLFQKRLENSELKWFNANSKKARILIAQKAREYFERKKAFGEFKRINDDENGILIEVEFAFDDELLNLVKAWIPYVKVVEPKELNDKLKNLLKEYIQEI